MKSQPPSSDYKKLSDEELVYRYVHRQEYIAMTYIYERYAHLVLGICLKYAKNADVARQLSGELFIKLLDDIKRSEMDDFKSWLYRYTKVFCAAQAAKSTNNSPSTKSGTEFVLGNNDWYSKLSDEHLAENLSNAIRLLKTEHRLCIEMFYLQNLTYDEIVKKTNYKLSQVRNYLQAAKKELQIKLQEQK
ncbi:MAG: sigma-70 family RNA polymerase sigma factor [Bacteroidota bacterium]